MLIQIPIVELINVFSVVLLVFLVAKLWGKTLKNPIPSLVSFSLFFTFLLASLFLFILPFLLIEDFSQIQFVANIAHLTLLIGFAFFLRTILLLTLPSKPNLPIIIPLFIIGAGILTFIWQTIQFTPARYVELFSSEKLLIIMYHNNAPPLSNIFQGLIGLFVFFSGAVLFFREMYQLDSEKALKMRALLIALGSIFGIIAVLANFILAIDPGYSYFFILAAIATLVAIILIYRGIMISPKT